MTERRTFLAAVAWASMLLAARFASPAAAQPARPGGSELPPLERLSVEELMQVEVATVGGFRQTLSEAPAAIYVLSGDEIRRSGHQSVAEALRMVPGMFVARVNNGSWVIGARGLSGTTVTSTRYLVLVDGRAVYDPLFSGTFWDVVDLPLTDIDRIEVIRGPGPTLWGVNAMNGVINVITKSARETQGGLARLVGGDPESVGTLRYGGGDEQGTAYRVWGKYRRREASDLATGGSAHDALTTVHGGFRIDGGDVSRYGWTLQGDGYDHPDAELSVRQPVPGRHLQFRQVTAENEISGANLLYRIRHESSPEAGWRVRTYYDHTNREGPQLGVERHSFDVDYRGWAPWGTKNDLLWGLQYDWTTDRIRNSPVLVFEPQERSWGIVNGFVQSTRELSPNRLFAMVGTKLTYHELVGTELQPSARLWWTPDSRQTYWAALSRPVRVPSRLERDGDIVFSYVDTGLATGRPASGTIVPLALSGDQELDAESMLAYELGYRRSFGEAFTFDAAAFYNDYSKMVGAPLPAAVGTWTQAADAETYGVELSGSWHATEWLRMEAAYSWLGVEVHGPVLPFEETSVPENLAQLRSLFLLPGDLELVAAAYYTDRVPNGDFDAYLRLDLGLSWRLRPDVELSVYGQNLLEPAHTEGSAVEVARGGYFQLVMAF